PLFRSKPHRLPLPSASAGSGGRDLPPLRGGQSLTACLYLPPPQAPAAGTFPHFVGDKASPFAPYLPPPQASAAGTFPHFVGDKAHYPFVPRSGARGEGTRRQAGRGRPVWPGEPVFRLRGLRDRALWP